MTTIRSAAAVGVVLALSATTGCATVPDRLDVNLAAVPAGTGEAITGSATFAVGTDVLPGRWTTTAPPSCFWARLSTTEAVPGAVIESGHGHGTTGVIIDPGDAAFVSAGCGTWSRTPGGNTEAAQR